MLTRKYKNTDEQISALGMGCMRFPTKTENGREIIDEEKALGIIDYAYSHGVNYFDTAYMYHDSQSEEFVGRALERYDRSTLKIVTKLPIWMADSPADMRRIFDEQLTNLRTDYFDFYLLHALDREKFDRCKQFGAYEFLKELKRQGKIRHIGFSFHDSPEILQQIVDEYEWDFAQIQLNYYDWEFQNAKQQHEILSKKGIPCVVMEPVRGGALANPCESANEIFKAARPDKSVASWAVRYVESLPNILTVLSGMSSMEQVCDNVQTLTDFEPLTKKDEQTIASALDAYKKKDTLPCTGCRYCMDCQFGVDIPEMFAIYNRFAVDKDEQRFINDYGKAPEGSLFTSCQQCGVCASRCPQSIDIPGELQKISELYCKLQKK